MCFIIKSSYLLPSPPTLPPLLQLLLLPSSNSSSSFSPSSTSSYYSNSSSYASPSLILHAILFILSSVFRFFETNPIGRILNRFSSDIRSIDTVSLDIFIIWVYIFFLIGNSYYYAYGPKIIHTFC